MCATSGRCSRGTSDHTGDQIEANSTTRNAIETIRLFGVPGHTGIVNFAIANYRSFMILAITRLRYNAVDTWNPFLLDSQI